MKKGITIISFVIVILGVSFLTYNNKQKNSWEKLNDEVAALYQQGKYAEAVPKAQEALNITEKYFGPDHPNVARDLNNLAQLLETTNRLDKAEPLIRRALEIMEKSLGPDHPKTLTIRDNLQNLRNDLK